MFGRVIGGNRYDNNGHIPTWHFSADDAASASCIPNGSTMSGPVLDEVRTGCWRIRPKDPPIFLNPRSVFATRMNYPKNRAGHGHEIIQNRCDYDQNK